MKTWLKKTTGFVMMNLVNVIVMQDQVLEEETRRDSIVKKQRIKQSKRQTFENNQHVKEKYHQNNLIPHIQQDLNIISGFYVNYKQNISKFLRIF